MKLDHCNYCGIELELAFENREIGEYITVNKDIHFCNKTEQEMHHEHNCSKESIETNKVTYSECLDCGLYSEEPNL